MGIDDLAGKAKDLLSEHSEQVDDAVDKVADIADEKTGGKYSDQIDQAAEKLKDVL